MFGVFFTRGSHQVIRLNPRSYEETFEPLELTEDQALHYRVIGEFVQVIG